MHTKGRVEKAAPALVVLAGMLVTDLTVLSLNSASELVLWAAWS